MKDTLIKPWARPEGLLGRLAGWEMSHGKEQLNEAVVDALAIRPGHEVLEVGFGPGVTVEHLAAMGARVTGADPSAVMVDQATRRNRRAIDADRVELHRALAERLPFAATSFDRALTLNSIGHWGSPAEGLAELFRVLKPGGRLAIGLRNGDRADLRASSARQAGFTEVRVESTGRATLVLATR